MPQLRIAPFAQWSYGDAKTAVDALKADNYASLKAYAVDADHFQDGAEWVGPGDATTNTTIETQYAPEDAVGEVLYNVSNAFSEPQIGGTPLKEIAAGQEIPPNIVARIAEAKNLLSHWWDSRKMQEHIQDRQRTAAWAGIAGLRLWIPWRFLDESEDGEVTIRQATDIETALRYIYVSAPLPEQGAIVTDPATQDLCAVFLDDEVVYENGDKTRPRTYKRAELIYLDPDRTSDEDAQTHIRIVYSGEEKPALETTVPLGGRLLFAEMRAHGLLTDPVIRTQRQLNLLTTLITRITETAAFRERYILNAKPQGTRIPYNDGDELTAGAFLERDDEGRVWQVIPTSRTLGANTTTELVGLPQTDPATGDQRGHVTPSVTINDPVDPKPYLEAGDAIRRRILRMCHQGHLGGISNAEASGIAYEQARAVFEKDLNHRRVPEEGMLRDLLTAVLALAEVIANKPGYFTSVMRITVDQRVDAGPRSPDLVRLDLEAEAAGVLSRETTMARVGVEDVEAELVRVRRSAAHIMDVLEKATSASNTFDPDSLIEVLRQLDLPKEIVDALKPKAPEPGTPPPGNDLNKATGGQG